MRLDCGARASALFFDGAAPKQANIDLCMFVGEWNRHLILYCVTTPRFADAKWNWRYEKRWEFVTSWFFDQIKQINIRDRYKIIDNRRGGRAAAPSTCGGKKEGWRERCNHTNWGGNADKMRRSLHAGTSYKILISDYQNVNLSGNECSFNDLTFSLAMVWKWSGLGL